MDGSRRQRVGWLRSTAAEVERHFLSGPQIARIAAGAWGRPLRSRFWPLEIEGHAESPRSSQRRPGSLAEQVEGAVNAKGQQPALTLKWKTPAQKCIE